MRSILLIAMFLISPIVAHAELPTWCNNRVVTQCQAQDTYIDLIAYTCEDGWNNWAEYELKVNHTQGLVSIELGMGDNINENDVSTAASGRKFALKKVSSSVTEQASVEFKIFSDLRGHLKVNSTSLNVDLPNIVCRDL
jgi:hypothetical protein